MPLGPVSAMHARSKKCRRFGGLSGRLRNGPRLDSAKVSA